MQTNDNNLDEVKTTSVFKPMDIEADPVDELLEVVLLSEEDMPSEEDPTSKITEDIIRRDRLERARYGVSVRDLWDFGHHLLSVMATGFRKLSEEAEKPEDKRRYEKLTRGCIALNERTAMNDISFFKSPDKNVIETSRWDTKWAKEIEDFQQVLNAEWDNISKAPAAFTWNRGIANRIVERLIEPYSYKDKRDYLDDPITPGVPEDKRNEHLIQRAHHGYSEWDLKHFRTYLVWIISQACMFFASKDAMGYPQSERFPEFKDYSDYLIETMGNLLRGEANLCVTRAMMLQLMKPDSENYAKSISEFTRFVPHLWD